MALNFEIIPERSRVGIEPDDTPRLEITYALEARPPSGTRQVLVPELKRALKQHDLELIALDLFDEFLRLHLPLRASREEVEAVLKEALNEVRPAATQQPPAEALEALERYLEPPP